MMMILIAKRIIEFVVRKVMKEIAGDGSSRDQRHLDAQKAQFGFQPREISVSKGMKKSF